MQNYLCEVEQESVRYVLRRGPAKQAKVAALAARLEAGGWITVESVARTLRR